MSKNYLTSKDISILLGVSIRTAQRLINDYLKANKIYYRYINKEEFLKFLNIKLQKNK